MNKIQSKQNERESNALPAQEGGSVVRVLRTCPTVHFLGNSCSETPGGKEVCMYVCGWVGGG